MTVFNNWCSRDESASPEVAPLAALELELSDLVDKVERCLDDPRLVEPGIAMQLRDLRTRAGALFGCPDQS